MHRGTKAPGCLGSSEQGRDSGGLGEQGLEVESRGLGFWALFCGWSLDGMSQVGEKRAGGEMSLVFVGSPDIYSRSTDKHPWRPLPVL